MNALLIEEICKSYGSRPAVDGVSLSLAAGEYLCLLGASGSGKTTLLRLVAGLEVPDSGRVSAFGRDVTRLAPHARGIPMVFQHLSLWPHMSVLEQIAFGVEEQGVNRSDARRLAASAAARVGLGGLEGRRPGELSGGQQQRVALARALVLGARLVLLDEPLANLDAHLRGEMRTLLRSLPAEFGVAVLHVTHDREDAFELADRVAVIDGGKIVACDSPAALYRHPPGAFAASLLGEANRLPGRVVSIGPEGAAVETGLGLWRAEHTAAGMAPGDGVVLLFRPEAVESVSSETACPARDNRFSAVAASRHFAGPYTVFRLAAMAEEGGGTVRFTRFSFENPGASTPGTEREIYRVSPSAIIVAGES